MDPTPNREPETKGPSWKHPYLIYMWITLGLFAFLLLMGYLAWDNEWIATPSRVPTH